MNPKNSEKRGSPQKPRPDDRPYIGDRPATPKEQTGKTSEQGPGEKPAGPDVPDYGDQEKADPRRISIEADTGTKDSKSRGGSTKSSSGDDGPVQSNESPSM